jgi:hypothetical protein
VYEVLYLDIIDPLEIGQQHLPAQIRYNADPNAVAKITIDQSEAFYTEQYSSPIPPTAPNTAQHPKPFLEYIDSTSTFIGDPENLIKTPSSVFHWRERLESLGDTERHYLPLWMRSIQDGSVQELGFVKAVPLCYCNPGHGRDMYLNVKNSGFDFKLLDYTVDRYIINRTILSTGVATDPRDYDYYNYNKYIVFDNNRTTI